MKDNKDLTTDKAPPARTQDMTPEERVTRLDLTGNKWLRPRIAEAIRLAEHAAEQRRDEVWREALVGAHYDSIDGMHLNCTACAPLTALLSGNAAPQATPPGVISVPPLPVDHDADAMMIEWRKEAAPPSPPVVQEDQQRAAAPRPGTETE